MELSLETDRKLIRAAGHSVRYLHFHISAPHKSHDRPRTPLDLALVLDRSGSMGGDKWPRVCDAAQETLDRLNRGDRVAVVVYDNEIDTLLELTPVSEDARRHAAQALARIGPRGTTDLSTGWLTGAELVGEESADERLRRCFLLTDGLANEGLTDRSQLAEHAAAVRKHGVVTCTFGVGDDYDEMLLGSLADAGGGMFHDIATAQGIGPAIDSELGDALEVVHADVHVQLQSETDLKYQVLGPWRVESDGRSLDIGIGDLVSDQELDLLVAITFPKGDVGSRCRIEMSITDKGSEQLARGDASWTWVESAANKVQPRDPAIDRRVAAYFVERSRADAAHFNRDGDLKQARHCLRKVARRIRSYAGTDPVLNTLADKVDAEVEQHRERMSQRGIKDRVFATRNIMTSRTAAGSRMRGQPLPSAQDNSAGLLLQPCVDSEAHASRCRDVLAIPRNVAAALGQSALAAIETGGYKAANGKPVQWQALVEATRKKKQSLPPDAPLPAPVAPGFPHTLVQVANETTLAAARRLVESGHRVMALNFANGIHPGGGFLSGSRAQEEVLCRSSALYATLQGDPMYEAHRKRPLPDSTEWAILSPDVPVFRTDDGVALDLPWLLGVLTCAAPYEPKVGQPLAGDLLQARIRRVLAIARAYRYTGLVLGAWGCGAFGNDPARTARDFRDALAGHAGAFAEVVFAIADWSPERRFLKPFAKVLAAR